MRSPRCLIASAVLTPTALAVIIGPVADLHISNANIAPDGFMRSGVLAEGTFPGPLITGDKCIILATQYCDGLRGVFVIYDPDDPYKDLYDVDDENTIITLADWTPDSTLINGLGRYAGGPTSSLAVVNVVHGKKYRFRLVSISCDPNFVFFIHNHDLTVIEVDGVNHQPLVVDSIQIYAGIRANPSVGTIGFLGGLNSAILRYSGAPIADPTTVYIPTNPLQETNLHPLDNPGAPGAANINGADVNLALSVAIDSSGKFTVNGVSFVPPTVPVLLQILSGTTAASSLLPAGSVYGLPLNQVIQISISTALTPGGPHPFHLHGHTFDVIRSAGSLTYNYANPVRRDVVSSGGLFDNVTIRFRTDNSGPWFLHCHIDWHLELGLAIVLAEDVPGTSAVTTPPSILSDKSDIN
ncbi:hypothetical protein C0995_010136 [Termitomyces sp. Mi166|nr:hypothetical protein C0995_010136 [Termitomyces sp. Mi166\